MSNVMNMQSEWLSNVYWLRVEITTATNKQNIIHLSISQHANSH